MLIKTLITHSGSFHADDLLACSVLRSVFPMAEIIRTRDPLVIKANSSSSIVFDVGDVYDPEQNLFDHHQPDKPMRESDLPYSSPGLIWKHFGKQYIQKAMQWSSKSRNTLDRTTLSEEDLDEIHRRIDQGFIRDIDALDNGKLQPDQAGANHPIGLPSVLESFLPEFDDIDPDCEDGGFHAALEIAVSVMRQKVISTAAKLRAEKIVYAAIENKTHPNWIELPMGMSFMGPILKANDTDLLYVISPGRDEWQLNCVRTTRNGFDLRKPLPAEWAGLRRENLSEVNGVQDAIFCHGARFFACAESREGVMQMLDQALAYEPAPEPISPGSK